jgi:putative transposase
MEQRLQFVAEYLTGLYSMTELAAAYGVSRRIGYYWVDRYARDGHLEAASRRPHTSPRTTPATIVERIRAARAPQLGRG